MQWRVLGSRAGGGEHSHLAGCAPKLRCKHHGRVASQVDLSSKTELALASLSGRGSASPTSSKGYTAGAGCDLTVVSGSTKSNARPFVHVGSVMAAWWQYRVMCRLAES